MDARSPSSALARWVFLLVAFSGPAAAGPAEIENQLIRLERDWSAASLKHDVETVSRILAP
jgi:hypothetical protein